MLQGPVCLKDDMTENTILFYKKVYPHARIILSTWNDELGELLDHFRALGATVVASDKPEHPGLLNVNLQLASSLAGVRKAGELNCKYAAKTRTDQRVCKPFIFDAMISELERCPARGNSMGRLVALGFSMGAMFIPYHTCDFLYLGHTEDLVRFFSAPHDSRTEGGNLYDKVGMLTRRENSERMIAPEIYMLKHYCVDVLGLSGDDTVEEYWRVVRDHMILFGMKDVDLMWNKYDTMYKMNYFSESYEGDRDSASRLQTMCFDYFNWLNLYLGNFEYDAAYERYADVSLGMAQGAKN